MKPADRIVQALLAIGIALKWVYAYGEDAEIIASAVADRLHLPIGHWHYNGALYVDTDDPRSRLGEGVLIASGPCPHKDDIRWWISREVGSPKTVYPVTLSENPEVLVEVVR